jgi:predicted O-methyltransferase YrrM
MSFRIKRSDLVGSRSDFAALCNAKHAQIAVEIGTDRGLFAAEFLERWHGEILYCVDPFMPYPQMPWARDADLIMAAERLAPYARRVRICCTTSSEFAKTMTRADFIYIDGAHDDASIREDLRLWWPRVRSGGTLAGDDFDDEHQAVKQAVCAFAEQERLTVELTTDYNRPLSWYIEKA